MSDFKMLAKVKKWYYNSIAVFSQYLEVFGYVFVLIVLITVLLFTVMGK